MMIASKARVSSTTSGWAVKVMMATADRGGGLALVLRLTDIGRRQVIGRSG